MVRRIKPRTTSDRSSLLLPPAGGAVVRMYRIGHGDCFLLSFAGEDPNKPVYVLIDCGYKPGSPGKLKRPTEVKEIGFDIIAATGGFVDIAIITHEHQDHVNGFTKSNFPGLKVGEVWFGWTEDPEDELAKTLRVKFRDRMLKLIDKSIELRGLGLDAAADRVSEMLEFELGEDPSLYRGAMLAATGKDPAQSANKRAMRYLQDCCEQQPVYLSPHGKPRPVKGAQSARAFVLGPPRDIESIDELNPYAEESFGEDDHAQAISAGKGIGRSQNKLLFPQKHMIPLQGAFSHPEFGDFFRTYYGADTPDTEQPADGDDAPTNASWRRIGRLAGNDATSLSLAMNNATNNSSLVIAFELSKGGKVLLFAADAQAGNWRTWSRDSFKDDGKTVTVKELLQRVVLYKVGHHGSHNATLNGEMNSRHANLSWMAKEAYGNEFVAMITAVEAWAHQRPKPDWNHPFPAIKHALEERAAGRVIQTDADLDERPSGSKPADWQEFRQRLTITPLYFDLRIDG